MKSGQLGINVFLEPVRQGLSRFWPRLKMSPANAEYRIKYRTLDQGQWHELQTKERREILDVSKDFIRRFREDPEHSPNPDELSDSLRRFLFSAEASASYGRAYEAAKSANREFVLAISAGPTGIPAVTNVPWELTTDPLDWRRLLGLDPSVNLCRLIAGSDSTAQNLHEGPLRIFYVISNRAPQFDEEAQAYQVGLSNFGERKQPIVDMASPGFGLQPTYQDVVQRVKDFSPHILIYIGHGATTKKGVAQLKFEDWKNVHELAAEITALPSRLFLVILISCDTSWAAAVDPDTCGPQAFISRGIPAVIAMQSKITPEFACTFLDKLLSSLFSGSSLPRCVTMARQGDYVGTGKSVRKNREWASPSLFMSEAAFDVIEPLAAWAEAHAMRMSAIEATFPAVVDYLPRPTLESVFSNWLDNARGIAAIKGVFGSGRTTLVSRICRDRYHMAARQTQSLSRPIVYLDVADLPTRNLSSVINELVRYSKSYGAPPVSAEIDTRAEERLARFLDLQQPVVLILDDADFLPTEELQSLAEHCRRHVSRGLLVLIVQLSSVTPTAMEELPTLQVDPLDREETAQYCTMLMGRNGNLAERWYEESSGNLHLLSLLRLHGTTMRLGPESFLMPADVRNAAGNFVQSLRPPTLAPEPYDLLASIAIFPGGLGKNWLSELFGSAASRLYPELISQGLLLSRQQHGMEWIQVPALIRTGFELIDDDEKLPLSRKVLNQCREFANDFAPDWEKIQLQPRELSNYPGMEDLFRGLQILSLEIGQFDYAAELTRLFFQALRELGRMSEARELIERLLESMPMDSWEPSDLLRLGSALHALGDTTYLTTVLDYLEHYGVERLTDYYRVTFWNLRANCLKDQAAIQRTDEMLELYAKAEALAKKCLATEGDRAKDWLEQLAYTYHNRALTVRYMKRDLSAAQEELKHSAELAQEAGNIILKAKSDMERAEIQLDVPGHVPDWASVEEWLSSARKVFLDYGSQENLAFCMYQIARLFKKRPVPDVQKAIAGYDDCRKEAAKVGLDRLAAIALRHRTELAWREGSLSSVEAKSDLDSAIQTLRYFGGDAWSTRVLRDSQFLVAQIFMRDNETDSAMIRLREAWGLAFQAFLHPDREGSDRTRAACIAIFWIKNFGWSDDPGFLSLLNTLLGYQVSEQQRAIALDKLEHLCQEVK